MSISTEDSVLAYLIDPSNHFVLTLNWDKARLPYAEAIKLQLRSSVQHKENFNLHMTNLAPSLNEGHKN